MQLPFRILCAFFFAGIPLLKADNLAARVVLVANRNDPDSLRIARHYAEVRDVPVENIIALPMPGAETISWPEFIHSIWEPLEATLVRRKWIDAIPMALTDELGRTKYSVWRHRIAYLVVCRGVPLRIKNDPDRFVANAPLTENPQFRTNAGAVDSELSLLASPNYPINAFVPNPLYRNDHIGASDSEMTIKVSRLDGPSAGAALALVDHAVAAERTGLLGRAYVDTGGIHPDGDRWLEATAKELIDLGFDVDVDRTPTTVPETARFDAPVLYFGWYAGALNGPFALPGFEFPPGAIALHIHSFSAETLRSAEAHWCGPLVARGVTATVGNVFEPYLQLTHRPDLLLRALARGDTFGDAAYYAAPALSWQTIAIGDPLYRPFAVPLDTQGKKGRGISPELFGYAMVREMIRLDAAHKSEEAIVAGQTAQREHATLAVGFELSRRWRAAGNTKAAANALDFMQNFKTYRTDEWALASEAAGFLAANGNPDTAAAVYRNLFRSPEVPLRLRLAWLPKARSAAIAAHNQAQADLWQDEMEKMGAQLAAEKK